jgi:hypothetical protein
MSKTLVVNSIPFEYPEQGEQQPWGESATAWASEVTDLLNFVVGTFDKLESAAEIKEIQTLAAPNPAGLISGLVFPSISVRSFVLTGSLSRKYTTATLPSASPAPFSVAEQFTLTGIFDDSSATWTIQKESVGDCFVSFDIDSSGQLYYQSEDLTTIYSLTSTAGYSGLLKYKASTLLKT